MAIRHQTIIGAHIGASLATLVTYRSVIRTYRPSIR